MKPKRLEKLEANSIVLAPSTTCLIASIGKDIRSSLLLVVFLAIFTIY